MTCKPCSKACLSCYGGTDKDCIECNTPEGYEKNSYDSGWCLLKQCSPGTYLKATSDSKSLQCLNCHETCASCDSIDNCLECKNGYIKLSKDPQEKGLCGGCPQGYELSPNGVCVGNELL